MSKFDIESCINSVVAEQIRLALEPYRKVFEFMDAFVHAVQERRSELNAEKSTAASISIVAARAVASGCVSSLRARDEEQTPSVADAVEGADVADDSVPETAQRASRTQRIQRRISPSPFKLGQIVEYKQGRGAFLAKVIGISETVELVTLERVTDGKQIVRPESKVSSNASVAFSPVQLAMPIKPFIRRNGAVAEINSNRSLNSASAATEGIKENVEELLSVVRHNFAVSGSRH